MDYWKGLFLCNCSTHIGHICRPVRSTIYHQRPITKWFKPLRPGPALWNALSTNKRHVCGLAKVGVRVRLHYIHIWSRCVIAHPCPKHNAAVNTLCWLKQAHKNTSEKECQLASISKIWLPLRKTGLATFCKVKNNPKDRSSAVNKH